MLGQKLYRRPVFRCRKSGFRWEFSIQIGCRFGENRFPPAVQAWEQGQPLQVKFQSAVGAKNGRPQYREKYEIWSTRLYAGKDFTADGCRGEPR